MKGEKWWAGRLRAARKERGLSQQQMADRLGVSRPTYSNWELGNREPSLSDFCRLAELMDVPVSYLTDPRASRHLVTERGDVYRAVKGGEGSSQAEASLADLYSPNCPPPSSALNRSLQDYLRSTLAKYRSPRKGEIYHLWKLSESFGVSFHADEERWDQLLIAIRRALELATGRNATDDDAYPLPEDESLHR